MKKTLLACFFLTLIAALASACKSDEIQTEDLIVTPSPTQQPLAKRPDVTDEIIAVMRDGIEWSLTNEYLAPYQVVTLDDGETVVEFIQLHLVSSGIFDQTTVTLDDGSTYSLDVIYVYQLNHARGVIAIPLVIGFEDSSGVYTYFSNRYVTESGAADLSVLTRLGREDALQDARARLPKGEVLYTSAGNVLDRNSLDWENCPSERTVNFPGTYCQIAAETDRGYTDLVIQRAATALPDDWVMIGWFFSETPEKLKLPEAK